MSKVFLATFVAAAAIIVGLVAWGFVSTKGNHLEPAGKIGKLRTQPADDGLTIVIADFNIVNDSDRPMEVRSIDATLEMPDGQAVAASQVPSPDIAKLFRAYPLLGEQFNPPLHLREVIPGHQSVDRMVAMSVEAPAALVDKRKRFVIRIEDVTGPVLELSK
jgi:hypothetical protein